MIMGAISRMSQAERRSCGGDDEDCGVEMMKMVVVMMRMVMMVVVMMRTMMVVPMTNPWFAAFAKRSGTLRWRKDDGDGGGGDDGGGY